MQISRTLPPIAFLFAMAGAPAFAAERTSVYSDLSGSACSSAPKGAAGEHETIRRRCRTPVGYTVDIAFRGTNVRVSVQRDGTKQSAVLGTQYDVGKVMEWRGVSENGRLVPDTAILRLVTRNSAGRTAPVLAILRTGADGVCPAAFLDAQANANANLLARAEADKIAAGFRCGAAMPAIIGPSTEIAEDVRDRSQPE